MMKISADRETVERLVRNLRGEGDAHFRSILQDRRTLRELMLRSAASLQSLLARAEKAEAERDQRDGVIRAQNYDYGRACAERDEAKADVVEFSELAAELIEDLSKNPTTTWGQAKAAIRALGDLGDRTEHRLIKARAEAAEAEVERLRAALEQMEHERNEWRQRAQDIRQQALRDLLAAFRKEGSEKFAEINSPGNAVRSFADVTRETVRWSSEASEPTTQDRLRADYYPNKEGGE